MGEQPLFLEFPYTLTVACAEEDPAQGLAYAWELGACGEDWVWYWADPDHVRVSFKREVDSSAFLSRAPSGCRAVGSTEPVNHTAEL